MHDARASCSRRQYVTVFQHEGECHVTTSSKNGFVVLECFLEKGRMNETDCIASLRRVLRRVVRGC